MHLRQATGALVTLTIACAASAFALAQAGAETFSATATVKTAGGATATSPVTIVLDRKLSQADSDRLAAAFKEGGAAGLRKALGGAAAAGSIRLGSGEPTPARIVVERATDKGRLLTVVTDKPILFLGAGVPGAKPKEGYDFAVLDLEVDAKGNGGGTLAPAAKVTVKQGAFVVEDYAQELVRLTGVKKVK
jgi:hypothetical protein